MDETAYTRFADLVNRANLTVEDHTRIVEAAQQNVFRIIRHLNVKQLLIEGELPSEFQVFDALLKVGSIGAYTRERIRVVRELQQALTDTETPEVAEAVQRTRQLVTEHVNGAQSVTTLIDTLKSLRNDTRQARDQDVSAGVSMAVDILEHGLPTVYSPANAFNRLFWIKDDKDLAGGAVSARFIDEVVDIAGWDAAGAAGGAVGGAVAGSVIVGPGTAAGAAAGSIIGGASTSTVATVKKVWDWIF